MCGAVVHGLIQTIPSTMIWITRALSLALGAVFFLVLLLTLVFWQLGGFLLDPDSYASLLDENDLYEFALADLPTALLEDRRAVEEAKTGDQDRGIRPCWTSGLTTDRIVAALNRAVPPDWLQDAVELQHRRAGRLRHGAERQLHPGRRDRRARGRPDRRAQSPARGLGRLRDPPRAGAHPASRRGRHRLGERRTPGAASRSRTSASPKPPEPVLPPEWAREHGQRIFDEATPYVKGDTDELVISVPLADRVDIASAEVKDILAREPDLRPAVRRGR